MVCKIYLYSHIVFDQLIYVKECGIEKFKNRGPKNLNGNHSANCDKGKPCVIQVECFYKLLQ